MDNNEGLSREDLNRLEKMHELRRKANESLSTYTEMLKDLVDIQRNLNHLQKTNNKLNDELTDLLKKEDQLKNAIGDEAKAELELLRKKIQATKAAIQLGKQSIEDTEKMRRILSETLNNVNHIKLGTNSLVKGLKTVGSLAMNNKNYFLDQQKAVKVAGFNMGILSKQSDTFRATLYNASMATNQIGIDTKKLAQMQGDYSEGIGRAVTLNESGLKAMADLAAGTVLGVEGTGELVSNMDNFNISAQKSAEIVENMLNDSHKMGINGAKVTKALSNNLKMANKYHFKDGIKGMARMANLATRFKLDMQTVGDFADKIFDVEGAVEMSAQLQVLGGNWSALSDPFQLMYKARNDMEGLTKDIIRATEVTGQFNKTTGEIQLSGLEMHRLREAAKATGIEYEQLANMASEVAKNNEKNKQLGGVFDQETRDFINTVSQYNNKTGKFYIRVEGKDIETDKLNKTNLTLIKKLREEQASLEKRAKESQTFDETWTNIKNTFKSALLPGFEAFAEALSSGLGDFQQWMVDNDVVKKVAEIGKYVGEFVGGIVKWVAENPVKSILAYGLFEAGKWIANGVALGIGFNSVAGGGNVSGGMLGRGAMSMLNQTKGGGFGANLSGAASSKLLKLGGVATGLFEAYNEYQDNSKKGMSTGENLARSGAKGAGAGLGAWGGASAGAAIGTMIFPGIGTVVGGLIGGAVGAWGGGSLGELGADAVMGPKQNDFIARPGMQPIPFNSADTLVGLKKDGGLGKALIEGGPKKSGNSVVTFGNSLKIEGKITVESGNNSKDIDLDDPFIIRALTRLIQEELTKNLNGGKLSTNPL